MRIKLKAEARNILALTCYKTVAIVMSLTIVLLAFPVRSNALLGVIFLWIAFSRLVISMSLIGQNWQCRLSLNNIVGNNLKRTLFYEAYEIKRFLNKKLHKPTT